MFADAVHLQTLLSRWPATDIWSFKGDGDPDSFKYNMGTGENGEDLPALKVNVNHIQDAHWNYGANFAGGKDNTIHTIKRGGQGMFGTSFVVDSAYSYAFGGDAEDQGRPGITMCTDRGCSRDHFGYSNIWSAHNRAEKRYLRKHGEDLGISELPQPYNANLTSWK